MRCGGLVNFEVIKTIEFCAGHRVMRHDSKCANPHGHHYVVGVTVRGPLNDEGAQTGMVMDFSHLRALLERLVHDRWDHGFLVEDGDPLAALLLGADEGWKVDVVAWTPTAENIAAEVLAVLGKALVEVMPGAEVIEVSVRESPTSTAVVEP